MFASFDPQKLFKDGLGWLDNHILTADFAAQMALVGAAMLIGAAVRKRLLPVIEPAIHKMRLHYSTRITVENISRLIMQIVAFVILLIATRIAAEYNTATAYAEAAMALLAAWILVRLVVQFIASSAVRNLFAITIWCVAALAILGVLDETTAALDAAGVNIGNFRLSALTVIKGLAALFLLLYGALFLSAFLERKVSGATSLTLTSRVLIGKIIRITLVTLALLIGVTAAGVDLSLLAVFSGAIGLGVGFGLQKGISNLFSGLMLLMDKSIKPGDVIELPGMEGESAFGWVKHMGARHTEIVTRDNKSYLIPNEDFITKQVVNWSHGDTLIRLDVKFCVSYHHNPHDIKALAEKAAGQADKRVCHEQDPVCHLVEFGENGLVFKLRFWIRDAEQGITNIRGAVMLALWDAFRENNITIPYPHREIFIREPADRKAS